MDIIDKVTYDFEWDNEKDLSEETRKAFVELFDASDNNAILVARFLVQLCKWEDIAEYNDPIIESKMNSLRSVILSIKKQLNMKKLEEVEYE
jgi:hypothetical protein|tara:strand:- start:9 stop:284 length:276 start_codon:yes stop_codon:yes gene_type:complete